MFAPRDPRRRGGMACLDAVLCLAVAAPLAFALYLFARYAIEMLSFLIGGSVGSPFM